MAKQKQNWFLSTLHFNSLYMESKSISMEVRKYVLGLYKGESVIVRCHLSDTGNPLALCADFTTIVIENTAAEREGEKPKHTFKKAIFVVKENSRWKGDENGSMIETRENVERDLWGFLDNSERF